MNDDHLVTTLREPFAEVHLDIPVGQIISRGRAVRARRRIPGLAGALAVAAAATLAVTALLPAGHQPGTQLAAWTVTRQANGTITVTIRELTDPAGLQSTLRADGVPASVGIGRNPSCQPYHGGTDPELMGPHGKIVQPLKGRPRQSSVVMVIHPAAIPAGVGLEITTGGQLGQEITIGPHGQHVRVTGLALGLVQASQQCTGS